jgi:VanZ family protein
MEWSQPMSRLLRLAFWAVALFAFVMAVLPSSPSLEVSDKLQHMAAFFVIAILGCAAYPRFGRLKLALALIAFGGLIEIVQMIPLLGRDSQLSDWVADIIAVLIALSCYALVQRFRPTQAD